MAGVAARPQLTLDDWLRCCCRMRRAWACERFVRAEPALVLAVLDGAAKAVGLSHASELLEAGHEHQKSRAEIAAYRLVSDLVEIGAGS